MLRDAVATTVDSASRAAGRNPVAPENSADPFAGLHQIMLADRPLDDILTDVVGLAKQVVEGNCDISITLMDGGKAASVAYTGEIGVALDERQYATGHGPCLDAARTGREHWIRSMEAETRWPDYTPRALAAGVMSSVSIPLPVHEEVIGAMNIYQNDSGGLDEQSAQLARTFAGYAATALRNAQVIAASTALARQLQEALVSRAVIEQAKGILMGQRRCTPEAFAILKDLSQNSNRKLRDVARALVDAAAPTVRAH